MKSFTHPCLILVLSAAVAVSTTAQTTERPEVCISASNTYTVRVDIFASERGAWASSFAGCCVIVVVVVNVVA